MRKLRRLGVAAVLALGLAVLPACASNGNKLDCNNSRTIGVGFGPLSSPRPTPASDHRLADLPAATRVTVDKDNLIVDKDGNGWLYAGAEWERPPTGGHLVTLGTASYPVEKADDGFHVWLNSDTEAAIWHTQSGKPRSTHGYGYIRVAVFHDGTPEKTLSTMQRVPSQRLALTVAELDAGDSAYVASFNIWKDKAGHHLIPTTLVVPGKTEFYDSKITKVENGQYTVNLPKKNYVKTDPPGCHKADSNDLTVKVKQA